MTREQIIETMAIAVAVGRGRVMVGPGEAKEAERALSALEAAGMVVVPVEPTEAMAEAGWVRLCDHTHLTAEDIYAVMIKAAQEAKP